MIEMFHNFCSVKQLNERGFTHILDAKGVYVIIKPENMKINFLPDTTAITGYNGSNMLYDINTLEDKFEKSDKKILYIGKAGGRNKLRKRIKQLIQYGYKEVNNHRGGRAIWQIENNRDLLLGYFVCSNPENMEKELLKEYFNKNGVLPVANRKIG